DLDGQGVLGVDELDEHREILEPGGVLSQYLLPQLLDVLVQGQAVVLSSGQSALPGGVGGELPALGHLVEVAGLVVHVPQLGAAPQVVFKGGGQFFQFHSDSSLQNDKL